MAEIDHINIDLNGDGVKERYYIRDRALQAQMMSINEKFQWKLHNQATADNFVYFPDNFNELYVVSEDAVSRGFLHLIKPDIDTIVENYTKTYYGSGGYVLVMSADTLLIDSPTHVSYKYIVYKDKLKLYQRVKYYKNQGDTSIDDIVTRLYYR